MISTIIEIIHGLVIWKVVPDWVTQGNRNTRDIIKLSPLSKVDSIININLSPTFMSLNRYLKHGPIQKTLKEKFDAMFCYKMR